jgi:hypothetical protein
VCDYLTFVGAPTPDNETVGGVLNPVLPNAHELTGALVSRLDTETETYLDTRMLNPGEANPAAQVRCYTICLSAGCRCGRAMAPASTARACTIPARGYLATCAASWQSWSWLSLVASCTWSGAAPLHVHEVEPLAEGRRRRGVRTPQAHRVCERQAVVVTSTADENLKRALRMRSAGSACADT